MAITTDERLLWVLAEEMDSSIRSCIAKSEEKHEWVNNKDEAYSIARRLRGIFIASLVGEIEEEIGNKFSSLFKQLSNEPTEKNSQYWFRHMPKSSTPLGRAKVMWAIRIAYTHGNGNINQIGDTNVAKYLDPEFTDKHFNGIQVKDDIVSGLDQVPYSAIKTVLEIKDTLC